MSKSWHQEQKRLAPMRAAVARNARRAEREARKAEVGKTKYGRMMARRGVQATKKRHAR